MTKIKCQCKKLLKYQKIKKNRKTSRKHVVTQKNSSLQGILSLHKIVTSLHTDDLKRSEQRAVLTRRQTAGKCLVWQKGGTHVRKFSNKKTHERCK